ncbi:MAG: D-alanine--poly(phosphoribitol) ligase subunit DltC [Coriobacteriia bacterium]|nr:D-alanine--poly(phosphoribitol) ligase subunit DltC [Coriobacteriia bacterium]
MAEEVENTVLALLIDICGEPEIENERDADLFELGLLDSMAAVELLVAIEENFGVEIAPTEVQREEMNTVNKIIFQVEERIG